MFLELLIAGQLQTSELVPPVKEQIQTVIIKNQIDYQPELPEPEPEIQPELAPKPEPKPKLTLKQKIKTNHYKCDTNTEYIRADNANCIPKTIRTRTQPQVRPTPSYGGPNSYSYGYCTWFVKNSLSWVPNGWGSAYSWDNNARASGHTVSSVPIVGAVAQSDAINHVGVVSKVYDNGTFLIRDMNWSGLGIETYRIEAIWEYQYIYPQ